MILKVERFFYLFQEKVLSVLQKDLRSSQLEVSLAKNNLADFRSPSSALIL